MAPQSTICSYAPGFITYFTFLQLKNLKLWQYRNTRNVFHQQARQIVILMIRGREKIILIHGGCEKVIWTGGHRKVNGARGRSWGLGAVGRGKVIPSRYSSRWIEPEGNGRSSHQELLCQTSALQILRKFSEKVPVKDFIFSRGWRLKLRFYNKYALSTEVFFILYFVNYKCPQNTFFLMVSLNVSFSQLLQIKHISDFSANNRWLIKT